jgi:hypothetical protein
MIQRTHFRIVIIQAQLLNHVLRATTAQQELREILLVTLLRNARKVTSVLLVPQKKSHASQDIYATELVTRFQQ